MQKEEKGKGRRLSVLLLSKTLAGKNISHQLAYVGMTTALVIVANMFFEFKLADTQFSLTLFISALAGILIGPLFGFVACFLGDLVGFLYHSSGYAYMPWIGVAMGMTALIFGFIVGGVPTQSKVGFYGKLAVACLLTFAVCTVGINTTAFWLLYAKKVPYFTYLITRVFVQGQIWNSLVNYALLFIALPTLSKVRALHVEIV